MNQERPVADNEISLYEVVASILHRWYWIAIGVVVTAFLTGLVSVILPKSYRASSSVLITEPSLVYKFDQRIVSQELAPEAEGVPDLAVGDSVLSEILEQASGEGISFEEPARSSLRDALEVSSSFPLLVLSVQSENPNKTAQLANIWAEVFTRQLNTLYSPPGATQEVVDQQAEQARQDWYDAQQALIAFQGENKERILLQEITALEQKIATLLNSDRRLDSVLNDAKLLQANLARQDPARQSDLREDLATLLISIQALSSLTEIRSTPIGQLDELSTSITVSDVTTKTLTFDLITSENGVINETVQNQLEYVDSLIDNLVASRNELAAELTAPESTLLERQQELALVQEQRKRLEQDRDLNLEAFQSLERAAQGLSVASQTQDGVARIAGTAVPPVKPAAPKVISNTALGAVMGGMLGLAWILIDSWWGGEKRRHERRTQDAESGDDL